MDIKDLELKVIDALAEAKAARIIAEHALSMTQLPSSTILEPWAGNPHPQAPNSLPKAPFIKVEHVATKPSLAGFTTASQRAKNQAPLEEGPSPDLGEQFWEENVLGTLEDEI